MSEENTLAETPATPKRPTAAMKKADTVTSLKTELAEAEYELACAKKARAEAEVIVRQRSKDIESIKTKLIEALTK